MVCFLTQKWILQSDTWRCRSAQRTHKPAWDKCKRAVKCFFLPCWAAIHYFICLVSRCLQRSENLSEIVVWRPVIRCNGSMAVAEIQSDVICATSLIVHVMRGMANSAQRIEETERFPLNLFFILYGIFSLMYFIACLEACIVLKQPWWF